MKMMMMMMMMVFFVLFCFCSVKNHVIFVDTNNTVEMSAKALGCGVTQSDDLNYHLTKKGPLSGYWYRLVINSLHFCHHNRSRNRSMGRARYCDSPEAALHPR
jgi:hypothetical protein